MEVQRIAAERRIEALNRMEVELFEAGIRQEAKIHQEVELR